MTVCFVMDNIKETDVENCSREKLRNVLDPASAENENLEMIQEPGEILAFVFLGIFHSVSIRQIF